MAMFMKLPLRTLGRMLAATVLLVAIGQACVQAATPRARAAAAAPTGYRDVLLVGNAVREP